MIEFVEQSHAKTLGGARQASDAVYKGYVGACYLVQLYSIIYVSVHAHVHIPNMCIALYYVVICALMCVLEGIKT